MASVLTLDLTTEGFDKLIAGLDSADLDIRRATVRPAIEAISDVYIAAVDKVPKRTGRLYSSIGGRFEDLGSEWIGGVGVRMKPPPYGDVIPAIDFAPYAAAVELGADPHIIRPRGPARGGKKALWWPGLRRPVGKVRHPGQPAQHFLRDALKDKYHDILTRFKDAVQEALGQIKNGGI